MNQVGSNFFVGGNFVAPQGCQGCAGTGSQQLPSDFAQPGSAGEDPDQGMGMTMNQQGSNYFVMGDYIVTDEEFLSLDDFVKCLDVSGMEGCAESMKQQRIYDCVVKAEIQRRKDAVVN